MFQLALCMCVYVCVWWGERGRPPWMGKGMTETPHTGFHILLVFIIQFGSNVNIKAAATFLH